MRIFIYEHVSAGGLGADAPESLLREGRAMLAAVADDFARVPGVRVVTAEQADRSGFEERAARCDFSLVIAPEFDGILAERSRWVLGAGGKLLGCTPEAIDLTADKLALAGHWLRRNVPTPRTSPVDAVPLPVPGVCKPRQ